MLVDPAGAPVYVQSTTRDIKMHSKIRKKHSLNRGMGGSAFDSLFARPEPLRYVECQLEINEQIGVLGLVAAGHIQGVPAIVMNACKTGDLTEAYFEKNGWGTRDTVCWHTLTAASSLICTDDESLFGGITILMPMPGYHPLSQVNGDDPAAVVI